MENGNGRPSSPAEIFVVASVSCLCAVCFIFFLIGVGKALHEGFWGPAFGMVIAAPPAVVVGIVAAIISAFMPTSQRASARTVWSVTAMEAGMIAIMWLLLWLIPPFR